MNASWPLLSTLIWLPLIGAILPLLAGNQRPQVARWLALLVSVLTFVLSLQLYGDFQLGATGMQFVELSPWIESFNIHYHLGVDGFSVPLILLTTFFGVIIVIAAWSSISSRVHQYMGAFLALEGLMIGVFAALDGMLFYIFFEAMLIPMFLVIGIWGGPNRVYATIKFFLYTFLGSVFMLVGLIWLYLKTGSFAILDWHQVDLAMQPQTLLFLGFLAAFAVKIPMWPVHTWLPDAHVEAPTGGSVVLAAIMLKIGGYGFIRFSLPITPDASAALDWLLILLSLIAVVYIGFVALAQEDMKKLIAYSSISHMGFVTLGLFIAFTIARNANGSFDGAGLGISGAMVQMISHGLVSGAMFLCVGVLYDRMHSRMIADYGGVINTMPWFGALVVLFFMANSGLPGTSGFVGEFMVILGAFKANPWYGFLAATTLILGAAYSLWLVKRVIFGDVANAEVGDLKDIGRREAFVLGILAIGVIGLGVYPAPLLEMLDPAVEQLLAHISQSKV
ncbi:MAG: NADH-quinone oxidoreductase subunit M [Wenzhouxiangellaceae bacterium]